MSNSIYSAYAADFFSQVCSDHDSSERVLRLLYPERAKCASCGAWIRGHRAIKTFWAGQRTYCSWCDKKFTPATGTIFESSHLTYSQFEKILVCLSLGVAYDKIAEIAAVHEDTVINWAAKVKFWESHV